MAVGPNKHRVSPSGKTAGVRRTITIATGSLVTQSVTEATAACSGASTSDVVVVNPSAALTTNVGIAGARISAAGVLAVSFVNPTAATISTSNITLRVCLLKFSN